MKALRPLVSLFRISDYAEGDSAGANKLARFPGLLPVALILALTLLASRFLFLLYLPFLPQHPLPMMLLDAVLLFILLLPLCHVFFIRPQAANAKRAEDVQHALRENAERTQGILDNAFDGIVMIDDRGLMEEFNQAAERIFGLSAAEAKGKNVSILMPSADRSGHDGYVSNYLRTGMRKIIGVGRELHGVRKNGETFPIELAITEMNFHGERKFVGTIRDITRRKQAEDAVRQASMQLEQRVQERTAQLAEANALLSAEIDERKKIAALLKEQATTDGLTGILNRREFDRIMKVEFERAQRYDLPLALVIFDIDHFKSVNDSYGHSAGDAVLVELAKLVASSIRLADVFARWGGEEFILLAPGSDAGSAVSLAEKLRAKIAAHDFSVPVQVTCSFGVADRIGRDTADDMLEAADRLLYAAKDGNRNRVIGPAPSPEPDL